MRTVNIRELHEHTGSLVDLAAEGHPILILRRGIAIAELHPSSSAAHRRVLPDRTKLLASYPLLEGDSGRFLEEERS